MYLIARKFGFTKLARYQSRSTARVYLFGMPVGLIERENEDFLQHFDYIVVGVVIVVE
jgi:hypothetical protein